jgi:hypothetical protein
MQELHKVFQPNAAPSRIIFLTISFDLPEKTAKVHGDEFKSITDISHG